MNHGIRIFIAIIALCAFGWVRVPIEQEMTAEMRADGLMLPPLENTIQEELGQTTSIMVLGGLRPLAANMFSFAVWTKFENSQWLDVEHGFKVLTTLQPRSNYYWETGSWQLAYNAAAYYQNDESIPPATRDVKWRDYIQKGREFLERGLRKNPDSKPLKLALVRLLTHPFKPKDYPAAIKIMYDVVAREDATNLDRRRLVYLLVQDPENYTAAYRMARDLYDDSDSNHVPSLKGILFALQNALKIPDSESLSLHQLFGTPEKTYKNLATYYMNKSLGYPIHGMTEPLKKLEAYLKVPEKNSVLSLRR